MTTPLRPEIRAALDDGLSRFHAGAWWDAHEAWEDAWLAEEGLVRLGLQALIQMAAAFHKGLKMNSPPGMVKLLDASLDKLGRVAKLDPAFGGIDVMTLGRALVSVRAAALAWSEGRATAEAIHPPIIQPLPPDQGSAGSS